MVGKRYIYGTGHTLNVCPFIVVSDTHIIKYNKFSVARTSFESRKYFLDVGSLSYQVYAYSARSGCKWK